MALALLHIHAWTRSEGTTKPLSPNKSSLKTLHDPCSCLLEMAEAVLFNLATDILESLGPFAYQNIRLLSGAKDELQSLEGTVQTIQAVLLDAEKQQWHKEQVKRWLGRLKNVLYDAQDLLDDVATEDLRWKVTPGNKMSKAVCVFFSKSNQLARRLKVTSKIQKLRKELDRIKNDRTFHLEERQREEPTAIGRGKKTELPSPDEKIIGREEDKKKIKQLLLNSSSNKSVSFVAIVGKGGLGKTALARLVDNDGEVQEHFELKMWVCVSDVFDVNSIIKDILKSAKDDCERRDDDEMKTLLQDLENKPLDKLQSLLRETLSRKKYLLVLDDLWNEDRDKWLKLGEWLEGGLRGSKVLVTTRSHRAAKVTDANSVIHNLPGLSTDKSWNLFKKMAFGDGAEPSDPELEEIGQEIVRKCAGVPLAIRTVGGLLYGKKKDEWLRYKVSELPEIQEIDEADDGILQVLKFSYDHLPSCLKHCFAYCSLFPKDFIYPREMIIDLWVAQGFIESDRGNDNLEEVADRYLIELSCRSFLDVESEGSHGEVETFKMHDLMHNLAQKVAGGECKLIVCEERYYDGRIRHASFFPKNLSKEKMMSLLKTSKLRTFIYTEIAGFSLSVSTISGPSVLDYHEVFSELRHCRALVLFTKNIPLPSSSFGKLKHLRFLHISGNRCIQSLPDSFTDLVNLHTLRLQKCENLKTFSRDLRKLINLKYISIAWCNTLSHLGPLSELPSLRTLMLSDLDALEFIQQASDAGQSKTARPFFPSLERLELFACEKLKGWQVVGEYQKHHRSDNSQSSFPKLRDVKIRWCPHLHFLPPFPQVECLEIDGTKMLEQQLMANPNCPSEAAVGSTFNPFSKLKCLSLVQADLEPSMLERLLQLANNLEFMSVSWCDLMSLSRGMQHLSSLQELHLSGCRGIDLSCQENEHGILGQFLTKLRVLKILSSPDLVALPSWIQHVTTLQYLQIYDFKLLKGLPEWIENLSFLKKLAIYDCKSLEQLPLEMLRSLTRLKEVRIRECPALKCLTNGHGDWPVIIWEDESEY